MKLRPIGPRPDRARRAKELIDNTGEAGRLFDVDRDVPLENKAIWKQHAEGRTEPAWETLSLYQFQLLFPDESVVVDKNELHDECALGSILYKMWFMQLTPEQVRGVDIDLVRKLISSNPIEGSQLLGALLLKVLFPDQVTKLAPDLELMWTGVKGRLEELRHFDAWFSLRDMVAMLRLVSPEKFSELKLTSKELDGMKAYAQTTWSTERKERRHSGGLNQAFQLAIISSDDVEVTQRGIRMIQQPEVGKTQPLPEREQA